MKIYNLEQVVSAEIIDETEDYKPTVKLNFSNGETLIKKHETNESAIKYAKMMMNREYYHMTKLVVE